MARRIGGAGGGSDPGSGKGAGVVAAAVVAGVVAVGGIGSGTGLLGGSSTGGSGSSAARQDLNAKKAEGRKSARKGNADDAWRRLNMRTLKKAAKQNLRCVSRSFGQVREFFVRTPCKSLDQALYAVADAQGHTVVISVAWVGFRSRGDAREFRALDDVHGTGDISPLAGGLLGLADVRFSGHHYASRVDGTTVITAETEAVSGQVGGDVLDALAEVASSLPRA